VCQHGGSWFINHLRGNEVHDTQILVRAALATPHALHHVAVWVPSPVLYYWQQWQQLTIGDRLLL